jgi:hypothetical protein
MQIALGAAEVADQVPLQVVNADPDIAAVRVIRPEHAVARGRGFATLPAGDV